MSKKKELKCKEGLDEAIEAVENQLDIEQYIFDNIDLIYQRMEQCEFRAQIMEEDLCKRKQDLYKLEQKDQNGDDQNAEDIECQSDMIFIAESLPIISAVIQVGSKLDNYRKAKEWVRGKLPDADPVSVLAALTFLYIVEMGREEYENSTEIRVYKFTKPGKEPETVVLRDKKQDIWKRISKRVRKSFLP